MVVRKEMNISGGINLIDVTVDSVNASTGNDLEINAVTGKGVNFNLPENAGATYVKVIDSDAATVCTIDSNGNIVAVGLTANTITPATGQDLIILGKTGKDIKNKLTDADGARKWMVIDSADAEVFSIDSNGNAAGTKFTGSHSGDVIFPGMETIDFENGHTDITLSATQKKALLLRVVQADQAANIIGPAEARLYAVRNESGSAITIKKAAGTGIAIANGKTALVFYNGSDYIRLTADQTH